MPLQFQNIEIVLGGLDQKAGPLTRSPGALEQAINVEFDKLGQLNKRRGYQLVDIDNTVNSTLGSDDLMAHLAVLDGELVIFSRSNVIGLGSRESLLRGEDALVYRGPANMGACRSEFWTMSRISDDYPEVAP